MPAPPTPVIVVVEVLSRAPSRSFHSFTMRAPGMGHDESPERSDSPARESVSTETNDRGEGMGRKSTDSYLGRSNDAIRSPPPLSKDAIVHYTITTTTTTAGNIYYISLPSFLSKHLNPPVLVLLVGILLAVFDPRTAHGVIFRCGCEKRGGEFFSLPKKCGVGERRGTATSVAANLQTTGSLQISCPVK